MWFSDFTKKALSLPCMAAVSRSITWIKNWYNFHIPRIIVHEDTPLSNFCFKLSITISSNLTCNHVSCILRHYQRAGTKYSLTDVATWAANPLQGQSVFLVGEAYGPLRGWCEGAIDSCHDALEEGWGIRRRGKRDALKEETSSEELTGLSLRDLMLSFP